VQEWHSYLFCGLVHPLCIALDGGIYFWQRGNLLFLFKKTSWWISSTNCSNRPFQDTKFDPLSLDRKGHLIDYRPPCPVARLGSAAPSLKKLMKTHVAPLIMTRQSPKRKAVQGATQKATTRKRLRRTRPSVAQVNDSHFPQTDVQFFIPFFLSCRASCLSPLLTWDSYLRHLIHHQPNLHLRRSRFQ